MPEPTPGQRRIELYVRDGLPEPTRGRKHDLAGAVNRLVEDGVVASISIVTCSKRYPLGEESASVPFVSFQEWADRADVSLGPGFDTRTCYSFDTGRRRHYRVFPAFVLAVYEGDRLQAVYPHVDDDPHSVPEGIEDLRSTGSTGHLAGTPNQGVAD